MSKIENGRVYKITNIINGKLYIGITINSIEKRFLRHIKSALKLKSKTVLSNAIRKYGSENFKIELIKDGFVELEKLKEAEKFYIQFLKSYFFSEDHHGYNMTLGGEGVFGYKHTEDEKVKISNFHKDNKHNLGKKRTEEQRKLISEYTSGYKNGFYGKTHSDEFKKSISSQIIILKNGKEEMKFDSISEACEITKSNRTTISLMINKNYIPKRGPLKGCSAIKGGE